MSLASIDSLNNYVQHWQNNFLDLCAKLRSIQRPAF